MNIQESGHQWISVTCDSAGDRHVVPLDDVRLHETENCWCDAYYDEEADCIVHNAADDREAFESGMRKPS